MHYRVVRGGDGVDSARVEIGSATVFWFGGFSQGSFSHFISRQSFLQTKIVKVLMSMNGSY